MVDCSILAGPEGLIRGYRVQGHAGYDGRGHDIVCAAVSVLSQALLLGLEDVVGLEPVVTMYEGYLECLLCPGDEASSEAQTLLKTLHVGLMQVQEQYPQRVRVVVVEI